MSLKAFYANPYHHIQAYFAQGVFASLACMALLFIHRPDFYTFHFSWWQPLVLIPLAIYIGGMSAVFIHNATHHSFPNRFLNNLCGNLAGLHQLWGFTGWRLIHLIHHNYSDNAELDPHPPRGRSFWQFTRDMFVQSSFTISKRYREHWQDTPKTRFLQRLALVVFGWMTIMVLLMWYLLLGPAGFVFFYIPSLIANHLLFSHINYFCHPADPATGETAAANLNHSLYHRLANFFWCGIYFHGNHHKKPILFNPKKMKPAETHA